jgi:hypothetical protein
MSAFCSSVMKKFIKLCNSAEVYSSNFFISFFGSINKTGIIFTIDIDEFFNNIKDKYTHHSDMRHAGPRCLKRVTALSLPKIPFSLS